MLRRWNRGGTLSFVDISPADFDPAPYGKTLSELMGRVHAFRADGTIMWRRADLYPAIAANPFITFFTTATESGKFEFEWIGDSGFSETASASIIVE